jgi:molecular chaperone GrpE
MSKKKTEDLEEKEIKIDEPENNQPDLEDTIKEDDDKVIEETSDENNSEEKIKELEEKIQSLEDTLLRKIAEFENYKRRTENDQMNLLKYAAESFILKILPVYDDLQRSINHLNEDNNDSVKEGLKLVLNKFTKVFDEQGIKKIEAKGEEFDVEYHEALMQQPNNELPSNTVLEEIEAGYLYKDKVIRHAKVIVSQNTGSDEAVEDSKNDNEE